MIPSESTQGMAVITLCTAIFLTSLFLWFISSALSHLLAALVSLVLGGYVAKDIYGKSKRKGGK
jgi:hypothetical protein